MVGQIGENLTLSGNHLLGRPFSGLNSGLVIRVDVHHGGVEADGPIKQRNDRSDTLRCELLNCQCYRVATVIEQRLSCALKESVEIIPGRNPRLHFTLSKIARRIAQHFDERYKEVWQPVP